MFLLALLSLPPAVSVNVYPMSGTAPLTIRVRVTIPPDPANRSACLYYLSTEASESESCWPLNGEHAAKTETRYFTLAQGVYEVGAVVFRATPPERIDASRERVVVIGMEN